MNEPQNPDVVSLRAELAEFDGLCMAGAAAGVVVHELSNFLNVIILKMAVLEQRVPESLRPDLAALRDDGKTASGLMRQLQQFRHHSRSALYPVELNGLLRSLTQTLEPGGRAVRLDLMPELPPVLGTLAELRLLVNLLLTSALGNELIVRTTLDANVVRLEVQDNGPHVPPELLPQIFKPDTTVREGSSPLRVAACVNVARRLEGTLRAENRSDGGMVFTVELVPAVTGESGSD